MLETDTRSNLSSKQVSGAFWMALHRPTLETILLPGAFLTQDRISYWKVDPAEVARSLTEFGTSLPQTKTLTEQALPSVALIRSGASIATLTEIQNTLLKYGYPDVRISEASAPEVAITEVLSNGDLKAAQALQHILGYGEAKRSGEGVLWAALTVWVGLDADRRAAVLEIRP